MGLDHLEVIEQLIEAELVVIGGADEDHVRDLAAVVGRQDDCRRRHDFLVGDFGPRRREKPKRGLVVGQFVVEDPAALGDPFTVAGTAFKVELAERTIVRALQTVSGVPS